MFTYLYLHLLIYFFIVIFQCTVYPDMKDLQLLSIKVSKMKSNKQLAHESGRKTVFALGNAEAFVTPQESS